MSLYFVTGNKEKFEEVKLLFPDIKQLDIELPEIQHIDTRKVTETKLLEALKHKKDELIVEDTSLHFECLNGLPGPSIKWFIETIGNEGLHAIAKNFGNDKAEARTVIGYTKTGKELHFFEASLNGKIVAPRGNYGFGWDSIFQPDGVTKTFAEMTQKEKNAISMRRIVLNKLKKFMEKED